MLFIGGYYKTCIEGNATKILVWGVIPEHTAIKSGLPPVRVENTLQSKGE
jgi:hypothetical protein